MALGYRAVVRDQQFLMPPDMRDWVPQDHLVWTVLEFVAQADTSVLHRRARTGGAGRAGYDPDMLLTVLLLGYCSGQRSSRQLERLCETDCGFKVACAGDVPDHSVLARFRQRHEAAFKGLFEQVLTLAAVNKLVRLDTVAVDGTKIAADASIDANRSEQWVRERAAQILAEAAATDAAEDELYGDARGDEPAERMSDPKTRAEEVARFLQELEVQKQAKRSVTDAEAVAAQRQQRYQAVRQRQQAKVDAYRTAAEAGTRLTGRPPVPADDHIRVREAKQAYDNAAARAARASAASALTGSVQVNTTDPQSRIMKTRKGWVQGYNVQLSVSADQIIVTCQVGQSTDMKQFVPMMHATVAAVEPLQQVGGVQRRIGVVLADAGYASQANLTAPGPDRLIALGKGRDLARREISEQPPDPDAPATVRMQARLDTEAGRSLYKRRGATVEPAIGNLKKLMDRFSRRGLAAAESETWLAAAAFNLLKIHRAVLA